MNIEELIPDEILISKGVQDYCITTIDIVRRLAGERTGTPQHIEWDSDMVCLRGDNQRIVRGIIPPSESYVGPASVYVPGHAIKANLDEGLKALRQADGADYIVSGILHSHAGFGKGFSGTDYGDFSSEGRRIARDLLVYNRLTLFSLFDAKPYVTIDGRVQITSSESEFDPVVSRVIPADERILGLLKQHGLKRGEGFNPLTFCHELLGLVETEHRQIMQLGIAQAVVVDASRRQPFGIIGYHYSQLFSGPAEGIWRTKEVGVRTVPVENDMRFDEGELAEIMRKSLHICEHPKHHRKKTRSYGTTGGHGIGKYLLSQPPDSAKLAYRFVFTAAGYVGKFGAPDRKYAHYIAGMLGLLDEQGISGAIKSLGPLSQDPVPDRLRLVEYS